jgi:hypothetical protein
VTESQIVQSNALLFCCHSKFSIANDTGLFRSAAPTKLWLSQGC